MVKQDLSHWLVSMCHQFFYFGGNDMKQKEIKVLLVAPGGIRGRLRWRTTWIRYRRR